jgi:hypothetical protein
LCFHLRIHHFRPPLFVVAPAFAIPGHGVFTTLIMKRCLKDFIFCGLNFRFDITCPGDRFGSQ